VWCDHPTPTGPPKSEVHLPPSKKKKKTSSESASASHRDSVDRDGEATKKRESEATKKRESEATKKHSYDAYRRRKKGEGATPLSPLSPLPLARHSCYILPACCIPRACCIFCDLLPYTTTFSCIVGAFPIAR
jgi:hypothetical protein